MQISDVNINEVEYAEVRGHYLYLKMRTNSYEYKVRTSLKESYTLLEMNGFTLANKSTMINLKYIKNIDKRNRYVYLQNGEQIDVSRRNIKQIINKGCKENIKY